MKRVGEFVPVAGEKRNKGVKVSRVLILAVSPVLPPVHNLLPFERQPLSHEFSNLWRRLSRILITIINIRELGFNASFIQLH